MDKGKIENEKFWLLSGDEARALHTKRPTWPMKFTGLLIEQCDSRITQESEREDAIRGIGGPENAAARDQIAEYTVILGGMKTQAEEFHNATMQLTAGAAADSVNR